MAKRAPNYRAVARKIAKQVGVPESLFLALVQQESGFNPSARSSAGAMGLTQLMPGTARGLGVNPNDPIQNLTGGARYLRQQLERFGGNPRLALSAYNSGPGGSEARGAVESFPETRQYVQNVMALEQQYGGAGGNIADYAMGGGGGGGVDTGPPSPMSMGAVGQTDVLSAPNIPGLPTLRDLISNVSEPAAQSYSTLSDILQAQQPDEEPTIAETAGTPWPTASVDGGDGATGGMNTEFMNRLNALRQAVEARGGTLEITSGARSADEQAGLWQQAVAKYGSEQAARKWVAPPGKSNHDPNAGAAHGFGQGAIAADLKGDLRLAHELAPKFGLVFPLANEAWHIEPAGVRGR